MEGVSKLYISPIGGKVSLKHNGYFGSSNISNTFYF